MQQETASSRARTWWVCAPPLRSLLKPLFYPSVCCCLRHGAVSLPSHAEPLARYILKGEKNSSPAKEGRMFWSELRAEAARYAKKIYGSQPVQATQGNLSARDPCSRVVCVTPSEANYQGLTAEDVVVVNEDGNVVEGRWGPSLEMPVHTLILHHRHDIPCV